MMKALVLKEANVVPQYGDVESPVSDSGQVMVELKAASLNHRDVFITQGQYPGIRLPIILGSDGAGLCNGKEVVVQPNSGWGDDERFQGSQHQILGLPSNGTFAEKLVVKESQVYSKPPHLSMEAAAALPLAGLTAFRVLFSRCKAQAGERILITGAGGGVALFCIQFALEAGLEVYVTSGSEEKIAKAVALGATGGISYKLAGWQDELKKVAGGFDIIIDGAGGADFAGLFKLCNPGARLGIYGGTLGVVPNFSPQQVFWKQLSILGSTMGSDADFEKMLAFVNKHKIVPVIDTVFDLQDGAMAFERLANGTQFGKIVLRVA